MTTRRLLVVAALMLAGCGGGQALSDAIVFPDTHDGGALPDVIPGHDLRRDQGHDVPVGMDAGMDAVGPDVGLDVPADVPAPDVADAADGADGADAGDGAVPGDVTPDAVSSAGESCDSAIALTAGIPLLDQTLTGRTDDLDLASNPTPACDIGSYGGADAVYSVVLAPGEAVTIIATPDSGVDLVLALVTDCSSPDAAAASCSDISSDPNDPSRAEIVTFRNTAPAQATVFAVVEPFDPSTAGTFTILAEISPPQAGDQCGTAPELASGVAMEGNTAGHDDYDVSNGLSAACSAVQGGSSSGPDRAYSITVPPQSRLSATVTPTTGVAWDPAVYIVTDCSNPGPSCLGAADSGGPGQSDTAIFDNLGDVEVGVFVIVDSFSPMESGPYSLTATVNALPGDLSQLVISEIANQGPTGQASGGEFVEIAYAGTRPLALDAVYLSDRDDYYLITNGTNVTTTVTDFVARFPDGASIAQGEFQTVATDSITNFQLAYPGVCPTYTLKPVTNLEAVACTQTRQMVGAAGGGAAVHGPYIGGSAGLTNSREPLMLFSWNGQSDLVQDIDYVYYGGPPTDTTNPGVNKSGVTVGASTYADDTALASQVATANHTAGGSIQRCDFAQSSEVVGGNGVTTSDPTSENGSTAFKVAAGRSSGTNATPNAGPPSGFCP
jgi:hypothetical protein